ncbi:unnamed protein product [Discula destructiva]
MFAKAALVLAALGQCLLASSSDVAPRQQTCGDVSSGCTQACSALTLEFGAAVHPGSNDSSFVIWDSKQQEVVPACRVEPKSATEVARIVDILVDHWCRFAVKSGGHMTITDASNSIGGVTIDLHNMKHVEVLDDDATRANLGPGLILVEAYSAVEKYNRTMIGGRVNDVGLSGYTIGGGLSNLNAQYGMALDNVFEYELVLPNATIVNVSETAHPDLYFALRGGGNNFGIVTNFQVRLIPQGLIMQGSKVYNANYTDQLIEQSYELATTLSNDTYMSFWNRFVWNAASSTYTMSFTQAYYEPILEPPVFDALNQIPFESSTIRLNHMSNFTYDDSAPYGLRRLYATITHKPSQELHKQILNIYREEIQPVKNLTGFTSSIVVQALHINAINAMKSRGGNALGVESDGPLMIVLFTLGWKNKEDDAAMSAYMDRWIGRAKAAANEMDLLNRWQYINYCSYGQDPFSGYGETNKLRLQEVQKSIDPMGVFTSQGLCRGAFKVL